MISVAVVRMLQHVNKIAGHQQHAIRVLADHAVKIMAAKIPVVNRLQFLNGAFGSRVVLLSTNYFCNQNKVVRYYELAIQRARSTVQK